MSTDLWNKYCSFYENDFAEQLEYNKKFIAKYFQRWKKTALAKSICQSDILKLKDVPITSYSDYPMLITFSQNILDRITNVPKKPGELKKDYYTRIGSDLGSSLNQYMTEPYYFFMKTTGSTGESKWIVHGKTFWDNFISSALANAVIACSVKWGETKLKDGDKALNITAPVPFLSGWAAWATQIHFKLIPPIAVTDNIQDMKEIFLIILDAIQKGEKISLGGGLGSMFYMMCKYLTEPRKFFEDYYATLDFGLRKILLAFKLFQYKLSERKIKKIVEFIPLKGVLIGGHESRLYLDFFKEEFNLEPLNSYGSTEAGPVMRGDPDRKSDLIPDLRTNYLEFMTEDGVLKGIDELKRGETYDLVVTPFGSILFRYDMEDVFRVVDFRSDEMPVFAFEGRKRAIIDIYTYRITPNIIVQALFEAGLTSSDKWSVIKLLKPNEHLSFLMEKTWPYSEKEAEQIIFQSLIDIEKKIEYCGTEFTDLVADFKIKSPSDLIKVKYLKPGAFLRFVMFQAKKGVPLGQYKPPKFIPADKVEIYETLKNV